MMTVRQSVSVALALIGGSVIVGLPSAAGAAPKPPPVPQYVVQFSAIALPPSTGGLDFHSTSCAIGPATDPIVVQCQETGAIRFTPGGGSGTAMVTSALSTIDWTFTLHRTSVASAVYRMVGKGTESVGATPVLRRVKVTGMLTVLPTPDPTMQGTEDVFPLPIPIG
jgi:hypothetical protein